MGDDSNGGRPALTEHAPGSFSNLWSARWLLVQWVRRDFTVQYRQSMLGVAWAILQPLSLLAVYGVVLHGVLDLGEVKGHYIVFALCGLAPWTFISSSLVRSVASLAGAAHIIKHVYFPRSIVPLASAGVTMVDLAASTATLIVAQVVLNGELHLATIALVPIYVSLLLMMAAVAVVASLIGGLVRDIRFLTPLIIQVGFIACPVMYPRELVPPRYDWVYDVNPVSRVIEAVRGAVIEGHWPSPLLLIVLAGSGTVLLAGSLRYAAAVEHRLPDLL